MHASVVVATRNRAKALSDVVESLFLQELSPSVAWEIIVVDNNSHDRTREAVEKLSDSSRVPVRYCFEPLQGLSYARNAGIRVAHGNILLFTDDDIVVDRLWLSRILEEFSAHPNLGLLAGRVEMLTARDSPTGLTRCWTDADLERNRSLEGLVLGCNLAAPRKVCMALEGFDTRLGAGRGLACEDIDFAYRILRSGRAGRFCSSAVVYHEPGIRNRTRENLRGWGAFYFKYLLYGDAYIARKIWWEMRRIWKAFLCHEESQSSPLQETVQVLIGALIMAKRMGASLLTIGDTDTALRPFRNR